MLALVNLTCDLRNMPIDIDTHQPTFGWQLVSDKQNTMQATYQIAVSSSEGEIWNSGVVESDESVNVAYTGPHFASHTQYQYEVTVTDNHGQTARQSSSFATGKLNEPWTGKWITSGIKNNKENTVPVHIFHRETTIDKPLSKALIYTTALGIYELELNGKRVGDEYFSPGYTSYHHYIQYQTYDITGQLNEGANNFYASVANGWYMGRIIHKNNFYGDERAFLGEIHLFYKDGSHEVIGTDKTWRWTDDGPIRFADFYDGEHYDANREDKAGWNWQSVKLFPQSKTPKSIIGQYGAVVRKHEVFQPIKSFTNSKGELIYDLGQNFSGILKMEVRAAKGTVVTVSHAEILGKDDAFYTANLRTAKAQLKYTCKGGDIETYEPHFTFMGFRYIRIESTREIETITISGIALYSDMQQTGTFHCSNELINRLQSNIVWGQKSNFLEIPTDCPQRDERIGWTGDLAVFASTAAYNMDTRLFMRKWLKDLRLEQGKLGSLPFTVPDSHPFGPFKLATGGWGDSAVLIPWALYLAYGDREMLKKQYSSMKRWLKREQKSAARFSVGHKKYIWNTGFQFGDWLAPGEQPKQWMAKGKWIATAYYANSANIMRKVAHALGKDSDAEYYQTLYKNIRQAFCKEFLRADGLLTGDFQSAYVCALQFGLLPSGETAKAADRLSELLKQNDGCLATGFLGTPYLTFALSDNGKLSEAYGLLLNEKCPGWLYTVKAGGTTIWERWDGLREDGSVNEDKQGGDNMVSFNHYAYGAIGDWLYKRVVGLYPDESAPGYKHFYVQPIMDDRLDYAELSLATTYGEIRTRWQQDTAKIQLSLTIPANASATVILPNMDPIHVGSGDWNWSLPKNF